MTDEVIQYALNLVHETDLKQFSDHAVKYSYHNLVYFDMAICSYLQTDLWKATSK